MTQAYHSLSLPPLALYVHIPWCVKKCPYCDFNSHATPEKIPEQEYVDQLIADLKGDALYAQGRKIHSIFLGGGTPSLFSSKAIGQIIEAADKIVGIDKLAEVTLEANPGAVEQQRFSGYRSAGVNRLSIGAQSMQDKHLQSLGRIHGAAEVITAVDTARKVGFDNFNIDVMHGLPDQSIEDALNDLQQVIDLSPTHLSWYQLTIEQNTAFYRQPPLLPVDDVLAEIEEQGQVLLQSHGFSQYEISAFSRSQPSIHNLNYWQFGDYLGIGAGAHGKITDIASQRILRRQKTRLPTHYLEHDFFLHSSPETMIARSNASTQWAGVEKSALPLEFMMNALRLNEGVPSHLFSERTGLPSSVINSKMNLLRSRELLEKDPQRYTTTELGRRFLNEVISVFMDD